MLNPWDPSPDEIREWAYDPDATEPCQAFDLALAWMLHEKALLECASDVDCPKRDYFLRVLYFIVGDAVHKAFRSTSQPVIEGFIERGSEYNHPEIRLWQRRSRDLIKDPTKFDYDLWSGGGLVRQGRG